MFGSPLSTTFIPACSYIVWRASASAWFTLPSSKEHIVKLSPPIDFTSAFALARS